MKLWIINLLGITSIAGLGAIEARPAQSLNSKLFIFILTVICLILIVEHTSGYSLALFFRRSLNFDIYNYGQPMDHATALYLMLLPLCFYHFGKHRNITVYLSVISIITFLIHPMFAATLAFFCASIIALVSAKAGRKFNNILAAISIIIIFFMPQFMAATLNAEFVQVMSVPSSWQERINIWTKSMELVSVKPYLGWGLDTSDSIEAFLSSSETSVINSHTHNIPLQVRLETGHTGILLFCVFIFFVWRLVLNQKDQNLIIAVVGVMTVYLVFAMVSFDNWHGWWLCTQYLVIMAIIAFVKLGVIQSSMV